MTDLRSLRFDGDALYDALDAQREARGLSWAAVVSELNSGAPVLAERLGKRNHPLAVETVHRIKKWHDCGCHFALGYLQWLDRTPESFLVGVDTIRHEERLPHVGPDRRLRWDIPGLAEAVNQQRKERRLTWQAVADELGCAVSQVSGLRRIRYGTGMTLAMKCAQWLDRSAASFTFAAEW